MIKVPRIYPKKHIKKFSDVQQYLKNYDRSELDRISIMLYGKKFKIKKRDDKISVIYPVFGKKFIEPLKKSIQSLKKQTHKHIEIIISEQYTKKELYRNVAKKFNTEYISKKIPIVNKRAMFNPGRVRNMGRFVASNDLLYFTDADILFEDSQFIEKILKFYLPLTPFCRVRKDVQLYPKYLKFSFETLQKNQNYLDYRPPGTAHGGSIFITKDVFDFVGGYSEQFLVWGGEDSDLRWKLTRIFNLVDLAKYKEVKVKHIDHDRPYLESFAWERNVLFETLRRRVPVENIVIDDIVSGNSPYIKMLRSKLKKEHRFFS